MPWPMGTPRSTTWNCSLSHRRRSSATGNGGEGSLPPALREGITPASGQALPWGAVLKDLCWMTPHRQQALGLPPVDQQVQAKTRCCCRVALMRRCCGCGPRDGEGALQASSRGVGPPRWDCPNRWVALDRSAVRSRRLQRRPHLS